MIQMYSLYVELPSQTLNYQKRSKNDGDINDLLKTFTSFFNKNLQFF